MTTYTREREGFDPIKEAAFLGRLAPEVRERVLESEIRTAAYEAFLVDFRRNYQWKNGRIYDEESGLYISDLTKNSGRPEEIKAMGAIESGLEAGKMVVNFSPKNEKYDYPQNCVDFWRRDGEKIIWLRFVTKNGYEDFLKVWKDLGGEGDISDKFELLAKPVETEEKLADVFTRLDFAKKSEEIGREDIDMITACMVSKFRREFGDKMILDPNKIFRLLSAVMAEIKRGRRGGVALADMPVDRYLYGQMVMAVVKTGGCASFNTVGQFGPGQGYFVVKSGEGMTVMKGNIPEGYVFCKKCGVWYSGEKCPFCD